MTTTEPTVLVVLPYYNHAATLRDVAQDCMRHTSDLLVVDDGSQTPAGKLLEGMSIPIIRHQTNQGKGQAILTAAAYAAENDYSHIVTIDTDGQHDPDDLPKFFQAIKKEPDFIYVGKRDFESGYVPGSSRFGRKFSNFWYRLQTGYSLEDCQSGFRAYPLAPLKELGFFFRRYAFEIEVLVRSTWGGIPCRDIDIRVFYPEDSVRISHFRKGRDNLMLTFLNTHLTLRSILPWPHKKLSTYRKRQTVSIWQPLRSIRNLLLDNSTPRELASASAIGLFLGTIPLLFIHTISIILACSYFKVNKAMGVAVSQLCMPPFVPALSIELGYFIRNGQWLTTFNLETIGRQGLDRLVDWLLGSLILAPVLSVAGALVVYVIALSVQQSFLPIRNARYPNK